MTHPAFGTILTAMVTPFDDGGELNVDAARSLATRLLDSGSDGVVVCGTTGESPTVTTDEKLALFEALVDEVGDSGSVVAGTGTYSTVETIELTRRAGALGVDACLLVSPYYSKPPQNGLEAHFTAIADASEAPLILYDIPGRTGVRIERSTLLKLAAHERIVGVKDAVADAQETALVRAELDAAGHGDFLIYSGDDTMLLPHLAAGAAGVISVCSHVCGPQLRGVFEAWNDGKTEEATRLYLQILPLMMTIMKTTGSPIPVKGALEMMGVPVGKPRLPLVALTDEQSGRVRQALVDAGVL